MDIYERMMELFAALHEEVGEAQKEFNDFAWKHEGTPGLVAKELSDIAPVVKEMQELIATTSIQDWESMRPSNAALIGLKNPHVHDRSDKVGTGFAKKGDDNGER